MPIANDRMIIPSMIISLFLIVMNINSCFINNLLSCGRTSRNSQHNYLKKHDNILF
jgi:hypothetical protein